MNPWRDWDKFWFRPTTTVVIGLFRIVFGLLVLGYAGLLAPDLFTWFSNHGTLSLATSRQFFSGPRLCVLYYLPSDTELVLFFIAFVLAALCFTFGLWTRVAAIAVYVGLSSLHDRNPLILNGGDTMMRLVSFFMMFTPCDRALSLDRLRRIARGEETGAAPDAPPWAQRVIQVQVAAAYLCTVYLKIHGPSWNDGTAIYYMSRLDDFKRFPVPFVFNHMLTINIATYGTLLTECALATLIWSKAARPYVLTAGVLLHAGIEWSMNIPMFSFIMVSTYITFLDEDTLQKWLTWVRSHVRSARAQLWVDTRFPECRNVARVLEHLDVFRVLEFVDSPAGKPAPAAGVGRGGGSRQLCLTTPAGDLAGLRAARWLAWRIPVLWPFAPLLCLPGAGLLGRPLYDWDVAYRLLSGSRPRQAAPTPTR